MTIDYSRYIVQDPKICGGEPVVLSTRVPVRTVLASLAEGATVAEILEDFPEVDTVIVPVSGGGLIAGIALALKAASTGIKVIGVSMDRGAAMHASLAAGRPVEVKEEKK